MDKNQSKKLFKIAISIYLISFLVINWNDVSWVFNYKAVSGLVADFFNPYPSINASTMDNYFYPNHSVATQTSQNTTAENQTVKNAVTAYTDEQNKLEIPKISISVPIVFSTSTDTEALEDDLDSGVVYYPGSVYPGQSGQIVILGHSAPIGWPKIKHDWVFTDLDKLSPGDTILVDLNNKQYTYVVKKTTIIARGADIPQDATNVDSNNLTLVSCWPPGKDYQRITVQAELLTE